MDAKFTVSTGFFKMNYILHYPYLHLTQYFIKLQTKTYAISLLNETEKKNRIETLNIYQF